MLACVFVLLYCVSLAKSSVEVYCRYSYLFMLLTTFADAIKLAFKCSVTDFNRYNMVDGLCVYCP